MTAIIPDLLGMVDRNRLKAYKALKATRLNAIF